MKVNLLWNNPGGCRSGYLNIDPFSQDSNEGRIDADLHKLDEYVLANEASELVAHGILDKYPFEDADQIISHWTSRLAHGGKLTVSVVDIREVARAVLANALTVEDANRLVYGANLSTFTLSYLVTILEAKGLKILLKRVENFRAVVTAERP